MFEGFGTHFGSILVPNVVKNEMQNVHEVKGGSLGGSWERKGGSREPQGAQGGTQKPYLIGEREARDLGELESMLKSARLLPRLT